MNISYTYKSLRLYTICVIPEIIEQIPHMHALPVSGRLTWSPVGPCDVLWPRIISRPDPFVPAQLSADPKVLPITYLYQVFPQENRLFCLQTMN